MCYECLFVSIAFSYWVISCGAEQFKSEYADACLVPFEEKLWEFLQHEHLTLEAAVAKGRKW